MTDAIIRHLTERIEALEARKLGDEIDAANRITNLEKQLAAETKAREIGEYYVAESNLMAFSLLSLFAGLSDDARDLETAAHELETTRILEHPESADGKTTPFNFARKEIVKARPVLKAAKGDE